MNNKLETLNVYKSAKEIRKKIFELANTFPKEENFLLKDQIIRSTRKCPANIAEGYGRFHYQENIQFCRIARGSLFETLDHLSVALECDYIPIAVYNSRIEQINNLLKQLNGYINYLKSQKTLSK